jgi:hypothetical protein
MHTHIIMQGVKRAILCSCIELCSANPGRVCLEPERWRPLANKITVVVVAVAAIAAALVVAVVRLPALVRLSHPEAQVR